MTVVEIYAKKLAHERAKERLKTYDGPFRRAFYDGFVEGYVKSFFECYDKARGLGFSLVSEEEKDTTIRSLYEE